MSTECTVVAYHYVRDLSCSRYPGINGLAVDEFQYQLDYLTDEYTFVTGESVIECATADKKLPDNAALLTFDDGFADHYETVYPILKRRDIPGCFFPPAKAIVDQVVLDVHKIHHILAAAPNSDAIRSSIFELLEVYRQQYDLRLPDEYYDEFAQPGRFDPPEVIFIKRLLQHGLPEVPRTKIVNELFDEFVDVSEETLSNELYMTPNQLRVMSAGGMYIGSHGYEHHWLGELSPDEAARDVRKSLRFLESIDVPTDEWIMCYPYGSYDDNTISVLRDLGCSAAVTTESRVADIEKDNVFTLPRLDTNDLPQTPNQSEQCSI